MREFAMQPPHLNKFIPDISNENYHSSVGVSCSGLKEFMRSPAHFKAYCDGDKDETPAMRIGRLTHLAALEPDSFYGSVIVAPDINKNTKEYKSFVAEHSCKNILSPSELEQIQSIAAEVHAHKSASKLLAMAGLVESSAWAYDQTSGELIKCRPDKLTDRGFIIDLKTTEDASPKSFIKSAIKYGYDIQQALYSKVYAEVKGEAPAAFIFIAVEKKPPYAVGVYTLPPEMVYAASCKVDDALVRLSEVKCEGTWSAYSEEVVELELPAWFKPYEGEYYD